MHFRTPRGVGGVRKCNSAQISSFVTNCPPFWQLVQMLLLEKLILDTSDMIQQIKGLNFQFIILHFILVLSFIKGAMHAAKQGGKR